MLPRFKPNLLKFVITFSLISEAHNIFAKERVFSEANCQKSCVTPFGAKLGANNGVASYSNCQSLCQMPAENYIHVSPNNEKQIYTGIQYQCVEYARRWLIVNHKVTFGLVDYAYQIWDLKHAFNPLNEGNKFEFNNYQNLNKVPPKMGDLLIYNKSSSLPAGHIAIVVNVNLEKGYVDVAEENYDNNLWEDKNSYSRRLLLTNKNNQYEIKDIKYSEKFHIQGSLNDNEIIGWKRLVSK